MGEFIRKGQVEAFKKGVDKAMQDLLTPDLFTVPAVFDVEYTVEAFDGNTVQEGECLYGYSSEDGTEVVLSQENRTVGKIKGDGATEINSSAGGAGSLGFILMSVSSVSEISGFFTVRHKGLFKC